MINVNLMNSKNSTKATSLHDFGTKISDYDQKI